VVKEGSLVSLSATPNPSYQSQIVVFTAQVTKSLDSMPTGTVQFVDKGSSPYGEGGTVLGSASVDDAGKAVFPYFGLQAFTDHNVVAIYSGDPAYNRGYSIPYNLVVEPAPLTLTITPSANPSVLGRSVVFTARVTVPPGSVPPTGTVYLQDWDAFIGVTKLTGASKGTVKFTVSGLTEGNHMIGGFFTGPVGFAGATSFTLVVLPAAGQTQLSTSASVSKTASGYEALVTVKNVGQATASTVKLTSGTLGAAAGTGLPVDLGDIGPGQSKAGVVKFPLSAGSSGAKVVLSLKGTYPNGSISYSTRVTLP
jgi:hypothetical protein